MQVQCVHCGKQYSLRDESAGSQFACRSCGKISPIKSGSTGGASPAAPVATPASEAPLIATQCRHCGKQYKLRQAAAGMQFKCKQCGQLTPVAASQQSTATARSAASSRPARPAPQRATLPTARPQAAIPATPLAGAPAEPLMAIPIEPLAGTPVQAAVPVASNMLDMLPDANLHAASPFGAPSQPLSSKPMGAGRTKKKSKSGSPAATNAFVVLRILGGLAIMAAGAGLAIFGLYSLQNEEYGTRRPARVIILGVCIIGTGFKVAIGRLKSD